VIGTVVISQNSQLFMKNNLDLIRRINSITNLSYISSDESVSGRISLWKDAIRLISTSPMGKGFLYFVDRHYAIQLDKWPVYVIRGLNTHNEFLLIALGAGWLGIIGYIAFFISLSRKMLFLAAKKNQKVALFAIVGMSLISTFLVDGMADTFSNRKGALSCSPLFWLNMALISGVAYLGNRSDRMIQENVPKEDQ
jgi:O-antigen ligase